MGSPGLHDNGAERMVRTTNYTYYTYSFSAECKTRTGKCHFAARVFVRLFFFLPEKSST